MPAWRLSDRTLELTDPIGAAIVNVTTDSMFEGARSGSPEQAIADGVALAELGFEMLDVGAVPARAGPPVDAEAEIARLVPAVAGLAEQVALAAARAGAVVINDTGGGTDAMLAAVAESGCGYVLMHIEGPPRQDRTAPDYPDVVDRLKATLAAT